MAHKYRCWVLGQSILLLVVPTADSAGAECLPHLASLCASARASGEPSCLTCCGKNQHSLRVAGCNQRRPWR